MVDIGFLKPPMNVFNCRFGGEGFNDKNSTFFQSLIGIFEDAYDADKSIDLSKPVREQIAAAIKKHTKMKMLVTPTDDGNMAVDAGYINPGNVLNIKEIEHWLKKGDSKIGEAFKDLKKNVIKGYCNLFTGEVEGDFQDIEFKLYISKNPILFVNNEKLNKYGFTVPEVYAAFVLHECGHAFYGLNAISSTALDNMVMAKMCQMYTGAKDEAQRKAIIFETANVLQVSDKGIDPTASLDTVIVIFNKNVQNRDYRRTLSFGVDRMTSEVMADAYAIKMGGSKALVAGLKSFETGERKLFWTFSLSYSVLMSIFLGLPFFPVLLLTMFLLEVFAIQGYKLTSSEYDTPYRRIKNILRENIAEINKKGIDPAEKKAAIEAARGIEKMVEDEKAFFESTALQRTLGWIGSGSDFRKADFENYTADLAASKLVLFTNGFFEKDE